MDAPLSNLSQNEIKSILINYLRNQTDFTDFDYEGSNISMLLDVLAYNSQITSYNINLVANESALETSTFRDNVVAASKRLGYSPKSYTSSKINLTVNINLSKNYERVEIKRGSVLAASLNTKNYIYSTEKLAETPFNNSVSFNFEAMEGSFLRNRFVVDEFSRYILPNNFVDTETIEVSVIEDGVSKKYTKRNDIEGITSEDRIYYIEEIQDQKYEIIFGDGVFGRKLQNAETVVVDYLVTSGQEANGIKSFNFVGTVEGVLEDNTRERIVTGIEFVLNSPQSYGGSNFESINSIKYNSPRYFSAQNRAITASDYESIIKRNFPNIQNIKAISGEDLLEPKYGKIFIYLSLENNVLDNFTKQKIRSLLDSYKTSGLKIEFLDPSFTEILLFIKVLYDPKLNTRTNEEIKRLIREGISEYKNSNSFKSFGGKYLNSQLVSLLSGKDPALSSIEIEPVMRKDLCLAKNKNSYTVDFKNKIGACISNNLIYVNRGFYIKNYPSKVFISDDGSGKLILSAYRNNILTPIGTAGTIDYLSGVLNINVDPDEDVCLDVYAFPEEKNINAIEENILTLRSDVIDIESINNPTPIIIRLPDIDAPAVSDQSRDVTEFTIDDFSPLPTPPDRCF